MQLSDIWVLFSFINFLSPFLISKINLKASANFIPDWVPLYFAKLSIASMDLGCGYDSTSDSYDKNALFLNLISFVISSNTFGENGVCLKPGNS